MQTVQQPAGHVESGASHPVCQECGHKVGDFDMLAFNDRMHLFQMASMNADNFLIRSQAKVLKDVRFIMILSGLNAAGVALLAYML